MNYLAPPVEFSGLGKFSLKKLANAALAVTAVVYPPAAPVIAAGAAVKSSLKSDKKAPAPVAVPVSTSPLDFLGPQNHDLVLVGGSVIGALVLMKVLGGKK